MVETPPSRNPATPPLSHNARNPSQPIISPSPNSVNSYSATSTPTTNTTTTTTINNTTTTTLPSSPRSQRERAVQSPKPVLNNNNNNNNIKSVLATPSPSLKATATPAATGKLASSLSGTITAAAVTAPSLNGTSIVFNKHMQKLGDWLSRRPPKKALIDAGVLKPAVYFGRTLSEQLHPPAKPPQQLRPDGLVVPLFLSQALQVMEESNALSCEGIFRIGGNMIVSHELRQAVEGGTDLIDAVEAYGGDSGIDPHIIACLIKEYLR